MTENWIAERHKREEVEAALSAARRRIATLERTVRRTRFFIDASNPTTADALEQAELARNIADQLSA